MKLEDGVAKLGVLGRVAHAGTFFLQGYLPYGCVRNARARPWKRPICLPLMCDRLSGSQGTAFTSVPLALVLGFPLDRLSVEDSTVFEFSVGGVGF